MKFNQFIWGNFKETTRGKTLLDFFTNYKANIETKSSLEVYRGIRESISIEIQELGDEEIVETFDWILERSALVLQSFGGEARLKANVGSIIDIEKQYFKIISLLYETSEINTWDVEDIPYLSEILYYLFPEYCFPYYFQYLYYRIEAIFAEFGIFAPSVPKKNDHKGRLYHYLELCKSLYKFRREFGMSEYELPAFLYGFAVEVVEKYQITDTLPEPRKAFFVGGGKKADGIDSSGDFTYLDAVDDEVVTRWNGNIETQPGDIIVMYCLSPRSYIHSIWRAVTPGFPDPFFYFYSTMYIGRPLAVEPIALSEIKKDEVLGQMPLVKANMQGINGRQIDKVYYDRLLVLLKEKGVDIDKLPQLSNEPVPELKVKSERDVEISLLEPLLVRLGFSENDWERQMSIRTGRGNSVYPDYVIFPNIDSKNTNGFWVWEAKLTIVSSKQLEKDFGQAKSYARLLTCKGLGLISIEGIWLSEAPFEYEKMRYWSWKQVSEADSFSEIFDIAGNKVSIRK